MIRASGYVVRHAARLLHFIMAIAIGLLLASSLLLAGLAFRLSIGPINVDWIAALHGDAFIINGSVGLSFDSIALAWEGFQGGVGLPIDLRLTNITLIDMEGRPLFGAHRALASLSLAALLRGELVPRRLELDDGVVSVTRERGGSFNLGVETGTASPEHSAHDDQSAGLPSVLGSFVHPSGRLGAAGQLDRVRLRNFGVTIHDEQLGLTWQAAGGELDLQRQASGAVTGSARVPFALGEQHAEMTLGLDLPHGANGRIEAALTSIPPAMTQQLAPAFPFIAALAVPLSLHAVLTLDPALRLQKGRAEIVTGDGWIGIGTDHVRVRDGRMVVSGTPDRLVIERGTLTLPLTKNAVPAAVSWQGSIQRQAARLTAAVHVAIDHLDIADLAEVWPAGVARDARPWIIQNITGGTVTHGAAALVVEASDDLHDAVLTAASGDLDASNVSLTWLDQIPAIERGQFHLRLAGPDRLVITAPVGHQRIGKGNADLLLQDNEMEITGLAARDQDAKIRVHAEGAVASALSLLKEPRLHLLNKTQVDLKDASGAVSATINLQFPLEKNLQAEQITFQTNAHLKDVQLGKIVAGRDLRDGDFDLTADKDGLKVKGQGTLAMIPVMLNGAMDFNMGPGSQVVQRFTASGQPNADQLAAAGLDVKDIVSSGQIPLTAVLSEHRDGSGSIALDGDLAAASLAFKPIGWSKPAGVPGSASATLLLSRDRLAGIPRIGVDSPALSVGASAECADGVVRAVTIDRATFGKSTLRGTIRLPADGSVAVAVSGAQIDLAPRLEKTPSSADAPRIDPAEKGPRLSLDARFDRALLANGISASGLALRAKMSDGDFVTLDLTGSMASNSGFSVQINSASGDRRLTADAADAGAFLQAAGITKAVRSGRLSIRGSFDDKLLTRPFAGTARIDNARIVGVPALAKVLQAMTLYGMADVLSGPGIGASEIVVPFRYLQNSLQIIDARLFSASLGLTAQGSIDLATNRVAINGTIVPAYVFNSVLGHIPFIGKLFSPEVGGGLFAARYTLAGPFADVTASINPLSVLTPGFLRNLFDTGSRSP